MRDVLDAKLAAWGLGPRKESYTARELRADIGVLPPSATNEDHTQDGDPGSAAGPPEGSALDPELVELREGLVGMVLGNPRQLKLAQGDVANLAEEMAPVLAAALGDRSRDPAELKVLIDLAKVAPSGDIAVALAWLTSEADEDWLRRYAAYGIEAHAKAPGADAAIPQLFFRMKYEKDAEAAGWVARALQALGAPEAISRAEETAMNLVDRGPLDLQIEAMRLVEGTPPSGALAPSEGLLQATWLWISELSGEHFQLRGVDDGRFVLSSLGPWAAEVFAEALEDDDAYVRLHVAQVLERMGPRGRGAFESLSAALQDPNEGVRGTAPEALVAIAGDDALGPLMARLDETTSHADRVALARALSQLGSARPLGKLKQLFEATPASDLKLAAAGGLLLGGETSITLPWLAKELVAPIGDRAGAESLVGQWVRLLDGTDRAEWIQSWDSHGPKGSIIHGPKQVAARRRARAEWLETEVIPSLMDASK